MAVRVGLLFLAATLLTACATVEAGVSELETGPLEEKALDTSLPAQTLASGECGLFGYSTDMPPHFIFFASTRGEALYLSAPNETVPLSARDGFPSSDYGSVKLELGPAEALVNGRRYNESRLVERLDDGFERIRPIVVLESCGE